MRTPSPTSHSEAWLRTWKRASKLVKTRRRMRTCLTRSSPSSTTTRLERRKKTGKRHRERPSRTSLHPPTLDTSPQEWEADDLPSPAGRQEQRPGRRPRPRPQLPLPLRTERQQQQLGPHGQQLPQRDGRPQRLLFRSRTPIPFGAASIPWRKKRSQCPPGGGRSPRQSPPSFPLRPLPSETGRRAAAAPKET